MYRFWITFRPWPSEGQSLGGVVRMSRFSRAFLSLIVGSAVIAACGGGGTSTASPTTAASAATTASTAPGTLPKPEVTTLRIGISTPTEPVQFAEKLADALGIYQKYGFTNVQVTGFEGDGK